MAPSEGKDLPELKRDSLFFMNTGALNLFYFLKKKN